MKKKIRDILTTSDWMFPTQVKSLRRHTMRNTIHLYPAGSTIYNQKMQWDWNFINIYNQKASFDYLN